MTRRRDGHAPLDLFFGMPIPAAAPVASRRKHAAATAVHTPSKSGGEPLYQWWHDVAAECPDGRTAAEHCWPVDGKGWAHVVVGLSTAPASFRCVPAQRHPKHAASVMLPVGGLAPGERISHAQSRAELAGRE